MRDIQVFLGFANFYQYFIQNFNKIAKLLTLMLQISFTTRSSKNLLLAMDVAKSDEVGSGGGGDCEDETIKRSSCSKNLNEAMDYLISHAKRIFTQLTQVFIKAPILQYFDSKCHIQIKTDASGYAIDNLLSQLTNLGQWHPVAYYFQKMILAKTQYKSHDGKLLAIIEVFKTLQHYLKGCKYMVLVLINHNNLCRFMKTKNLSSCQVWWAQELSRYHFQIDYCQNKANRVADTLSQFSQKSDDKEKKI